MHTRIVADHRRVLREGLPLIDLRAPGEFALGAFPGAVNLPLLTDAERAAVGTRYKLCGQQAAMTLGEELVRGDTRDARIDAWRACIAAQPTTLLYCARGGLRSQIAQQWLRDAGVDASRIDGGYKALRRTCLRAIDEFCATTALLVIAGRTGSGKTELLNAFESVIDLERLVNHRGSAFGSTASAQPTPIAFENRLAVEMLSVMGRPRVIIEDEGRTIGRLALPDPLHAAMQAAPLVVVDVPRAERAQRIFREYVASPLADGTPAQHLRERFRNALDRIRRRLGGLRHAQVGELIDAAFDAGPTDATKHVAWIERLLEWYYDPMYDHQLAAKQRRVVHVGDRTTIAAYLRDTAH
jgi:tRNA 2-selenouridine synthase